MQGWGATCQGKTTNGKWSSQESIQHINLLELKAAFLGLKTFLKNQSHKVVLVTLDNSMAVAYLNNKGGTHSVPLMSLALEIWTWCLQRNVLISAQHVPGKENTIADLESRTFLDSTDWQLDPTVISAFLTNCNTDLFASRLTAQLPQYVSWRPDPGAFHIDALTLHKVHAMFPRLHLIVCRVSSSTIKQKAFLDRLPNCSSQQLGLPLERPTNQHGPAGVAGVLKGKFILFQPHSQKFLSF